MAKAASHALSFAIQWAVAEMPKLVSFAMVSMSPSSASGKRHGKRHGGPAVKTLHTGNV
jgi:hypothetical protein